METACVRYARTRLVSAGFSEQGSVAGLAVFVRWRGTLRDSVLLSSDQRRKDLVGHMARVLVEVPSVGPLLNELSGATWEAARRADAVPTGVQVWGSVSRRQGGPGYVNIEVPEARGERERVMVLGEREPVEVPSEALGDAIVVNGLRCAEQLAQPRDVAERLTRSAGVQDRSLAACIYWLCGCREEAQSALAYEGPLLSEDGHTRVCWTAEEQDEAVRVLEALVRTSAGQNDVG